MQADPVLIERDGATWHFRLNRPEKRNALSAAMVEQLLEGLAAAEAAGATLLVFRGAGASFCAGFDFSDYESQSDGDLLLRFVRIEQLLQAIAASPCVTLGLAQGRIFGAGVDLLAACRHRVAAPGSSFRMPGLQFGLVLGSRRFAAIVGAEPARRILEQSESFDAAAAAALGFIAAPVAAEAWPEVIARLQAVAASLAPSSRAALYAVLEPRQADADLAALVRSAAAPGLKARIARFRS